MEHFRTLIIIEFVFLSLFFYSARGNENRDLVFESLKEKEQNIDTISFSYLKKVIIEGIDESYTIKGLIFFKEPKLLRIEQREPVKKLFITDGTRAIIFVEEFNQVIQSRDIDNLSESVGIDLNLVLFRQLTDYIKKNYEVELVESEGDHYILSLLPDSDEDSRLKLYISMRDYLLEKTVYMTPTTNVTTEFYDIEVNRDLDSSIFKFESPKGAEIIDLP